MKPIVSLSYIFVSYRIKIIDRDTQEVVGYFETLDLISESYSNVNVSENSLKHLHNVLLKYSDKDQWHRGDYKQQSNAIEARLPDGTSQIIFHTTDPGMATQNAMKNLTEWYSQDHQIHPLVKCALFAYEFVSIHPFQDGNGRLSRLLATLLLLKNGYKWIEYVSFEHEIESRKTEYYRVLRSCQASRPDEDVTEWIQFFFDSLVNIQKQLMQKLELQGAVSSLSPREKAIVMYIENHPGSKSGKISEQLEIPQPTVKRILSELLKNMVQAPGQITPVSETVLPFGMLCSRVFTIGPVLSVLGKYGFLNCWIVIHPRA